MGGVQWAARVVLAAVFVLSAASKLRDRAGTRQAARELGAPSSLAGPISVVLPALEVTIAALLLPATTARAGGIFAVVLLVALSAVVAANLRRGRRPVCRCFGQLSSEPIGPGTLVRNGLLAGLAAVVVWTHGHRPVAELAGDRSAEEIVVAGLLTVLAVAAVVEALVIRQLLRQQGRALLRLDALEQAQGSAAAAPAPPGLGLPVGAPAPDFVLSGLHGETLTLSALRAAAKPVLLVFSMPGCGPCTALAPDLHRWQADHAGRLTIVVLAAGDVDVVRSHAAEHGIGNVLLDPDHRVADAYRFDGTPGAALVDVGGRIAAPLATGAPAIFRLVGEVVGHVPASPAFPIVPDVPATPTVTPAARAGLDVGSPAPDVRLPTVGGGHAGLDDFRGRTILVLFWDPGSGFCQRLLPELLAWEADHPIDAPELVVISTGDEAANAALGFTATLLLDATSAAMSAFAVRGTPIGVLVDAAGLVASLPGLGAPGVRSLLAAHATEQAR
jgi:peroxiredoxin